MTPARPGGPPDQRIRRVVVIAKECRPGRVKTRLTPPLRPAEAAELARVSLATTLDAVRLVDATERVLLFEGAVGDLDAAGFRVLPQASGGLDERIAAAFDRLVGRTLLVGMDTPQLDPAVLQAALDDDSDADAWFGPATDGGFWALGLDAPDGGLVRGVPMSRDDTGARQLDRLRRSGRTVRTLPTLRDVDAFADAVAVADAAPGTPFATAVRRLRSRVEDVLPA